MFKRITDGDISFDLYRIEADGTETQLQGFSKKIEKAPSPKYSTKEELDENEGDNLQYWAEDIIKYHALKFAGREVGMTEEEVHIFCSFLSTADLDVTELYAGGSFKAKNISGQPYNFEELGEEPEKKPKATPYEIEKRKRLKKIIKQKRAALEILEAELRKLEETVEF